MRAHSQDLRQRVLQAVDEGMSRAEIIERFQVSRATIKRYLKQRREMGNVLPRPIPGRPRMIGKALQPHLAKQLEAYPGATVADHCRIWEDKQVMTVSWATMRRAILTVGWRRS
jgi:transposase